MPFFILYYHYVVKININKQSRILTRIIITKSTMIFGASPVLRFNS